MITRLRQEGYSYKEKADALRVSINTVKSSCRRNNLTVNYEKKRHICINCGKEIKDGKSSAHLGVGKLGGIIIWTR